MKRNLWTAILAGAGMLMLILDTKTALAGAADGIELCIRVVIPSLLPFFFLSNVLTSSLTGVSIPIFGSICRICGVPKGGESLLLMGLLGGYPVGAQNVAAAYRDGRLTKGQAEHLLSFCSNAGPSFLFGIVAAQFTQWWMGWLLWGVHIASALLVGFLQSGQRDGTVKLNRAGPVSPIAALHSSLAIMASVCGWIILFRVMLHFLQNWLLWLFPQAIQTLIIGSLELTNGCCQLSLIENTGLRFIIAAGLLSFGGLCVTMQTATAVGSLGIKSYTKGKLLQALISIIIAFGIQLLFPVSIRVELHGAIAAIIPIILAFFAVMLRESEKRSSVFSGNRV